MNYSLERIPSVDDEFRLVDEFKFIEARSIAPPFAEAAASK